MKAWRKHARDGTLPPVLLLSVSGLNTHLILDGHDRLAAAWAEGVAPAVFVLMPVSEAESDEREVERSVGVYTNYFDAPFMNEHGRDTLARSLVRAFTPLLLPELSTAVARNTLDEEWDEEVRARVGEREFHAVVPSAQASNGSTQ